MYDCRQFRSAVMSLISDPLEPQSLVDIITKRLETSIISGELEPGARISEQGLAKMLGVSRGPLREAISRLEGRKLIERKTNLGARVASLSSEDLIDRLVVREALEGMAARLAALALEDAEIEVLRKLLTEHGRQKSVRTGTGYLQESADFDFHFLIINGSKNLPLIAMVRDELYDRLRVYRYKSSTLDGRARAAFDEHTDIVDALAARDPDRSEAAMRRHLRNAREHMIAQMNAERM